MHDTILLLKYLYTILKQAFLSFSKLKRFIQSILITSAKYVKLNIVCQSIMCRDTVYCREKPLSPDIKFCR